MSDYLRKQRLTLSECILLYIVFTYAPTTRLITQLTIETAHEAAWLIPLISCIIYVPLIAVVVTLMKKFEGRSYADIMSNVFGNPLAKVITIVLTVYLILLMALYIRYSTDQLTSTIYTGTDYRIFLFFGILSIFIILRSGIAVVGRMNKIVFVLLLVQFLLLLVLLLNDIKIENVTPIYVRDFSQFFTGSFYVTAIMGYVSFLLIFNDKIILHDKINREFIRAGIFLITASTLIIFWTLAIFGWNVTEKLNYPFFQAIKGVIVLNKVTGMEALFMSFWLLAEFINISFFCYCILHLLRGILKIKDELPLFSVFLIFMFFFSQIFSSNIVELQTFSRQIAVPVNNILAVGLPFAVYLTAKARKII